jgi:3-oxoacyl-[acyl-carrier protein] reductase
VAISYAENVAAANKTVTEIKSHGAASVAICANLLDEDFGEKLVQEALAGLKTDIIHIVVNNAAIAEVRQLKPLFEMTHELVNLAIPWSRCLD